MIDIKKILVDNGVSSELVDTIADTIKAEIPKEFVSKAQYNKKVSQIDDLNNKVADLEVTSSNDTSKAELDRVKKEFDAFKENIETEKINKTKTQTLVQKLKQEGANEKLVNLLLKEFDLNKIQIDGAEVKDWENVVRPVKEAYSDCFATTTVVGTPPATPPTGSTAPKYTMESIKGMSVEQIKQNYEAIKKDLASN